MNDPRPVIRGTAAWALKQIGGEQAEDALRRALPRETDEEAANEIRRLLAADEAVVQHGYEQP